MDIETALSLETQQHPANRGRYLRQFFSPDMIPGMVLLCDIAIIIVTGLASLVLLTVDGDVCFSQHYVIALAFSVLLQVNLKYFSKHPIFSQTRATGQQIQRVVLTWTGSLLAITGLFFLLQISDRLSRGWLILWYFGALIGLIAFRFWLPLFLHRLHIALSHRTIVVGTQSQLNALQQRLNDKSGQSNFDTLVLECQDQNNESLRHYMNNIKRELRVRSIDCVCIIGNAEQSTYLHTLAMELSELPADIVLCSIPLVDLPLRGLTTVHSLPVLRLYDRPLKDWRALIKILEDYILASVMLLLCFPLMFLISIAVKLDSPGPIFFRQVRFGFNNIPFQAYKFRSMYVNKGDVTGAQRTVRNDPRVTAVGNFLRKTSLDELPQLLNVLRGEMSIVGPRAHPVRMMVGDKYYHDAVRRYLSRHRVRPGITGLAQIKGLRGEVDTYSKAQKRVKYDLYYIKKWSLWLDLRIILMTLVKGLVSRDAF